MRCRRRVEQRAALIAAAGVPTLVLVYRTPLLEQWRDQLVSLLDLDADQIGQLTGGRDRRSGVVDIATVQTLTRRDDIAELTSRYGLLIVDECHHVPAVTIGQVVGQIPARRVLGLTATPYRQDGLDALIAMHCGPIRHHPGKTPTGMQLRLEVHDTRFAFPSNEQAGIQQIFTALANDPRRTRQIATDVAEAVAAGRHCLVLSERKAHLAALANDLREHGVDVLVLHGSLTRADKQQAMDRLETVAQQRVAVVATGQYVGEGFDCPPLDTLFLTFPISSKAKLVQYVGRVLRPFDGKHTVTVHDYHDAEIPVLHRMHDRRRKTYRSLGLVGRNDHQPQLSLDL